MLRRLSNFNIVLRSLTSSFRPLSTQGTPPTGTKEPLEIIDFDDPEHLPLPVYPKRPDEPLDTRKQRLLYQSRKRGMLENDLLLSTFAAKYLKSMTAEETALYDNLINGPTNDWDIYYWATGAKPIPEEYNNRIMSMFTEHVKNVNKEERSRQPAL